MRFGLAATLILCAATARAEEPTLALPIDCTPGETCFIQSYVDHDPGPGVRDFACGPLSFDGHKGTDFALDSLAQMQAGVDVFPARPGRVIAVRDGVPDALFENGTDLGGRDCGNGVLIDHHDGWQTQYCHMKNGSIRVGEGEPVFETTALGQVGLSGKTQFPHLHIAVRKDGKVVDPFRPDGAGDCAEPASNLWRDPLAYVPGELITSGFADAVPSYDAIKAGTAGLRVIAPAGDAVVLWAYLFGGRAGDVIQFEFNGPGGLAFSNSATLEKPQAQLFRASGKRRTVATWPTGPVTGTVRLIRDGVEIDRQQANVQIGK